MSVHHYPGRTTILIALALVASVLIGAKIGKGGKKTHLGVPPSQIVNLHTQTMLNDNSGGNVFYYNRLGSSQFIVPPKYSFVVTDVILEPNDLTETDDYLVVVSIGPMGSRTFQFQTLNQRQLHFAFTGGMVMPSGHTPSARNTTFSTNSCEIQLLGYFVRGKALDEGESPVPGL
jgi:hypothetical protein